MAEKPTPDFELMLETLTKHDAAFIVIGNLSAVLQGAAVSTFDLDVVQLRTPENLDRLVAALLELGAYYRGQGDRRLKPRAEVLKSDGHHLFMTVAGPLDVLGTVGNNQSYDDLLPRSSELPLASGRKIRLVNLATLIELKEHANRDKDRAVLPELRSTLARLQNLPPSAPE
ncbi:MAG: hypothetical protein JNM56_30380 [Planctomycetia bacterium]|nr:hypothetical protein [Planctomycetia bacterium]